MPTPLVPTFTGFVGSNLDALLIIEASLNNKLPLVQRRPMERERGELIKSGHVFVFVEKSSEIKRWTDGIAWSASRILGRFLIYRALDKVAEKDKRKGRKNSRSREPASKTEDKPTITGYVDKYLGFNNCFNYGQEKSVPDYSKTLRSCPSYDHSNTEPLSFNISNSVYGEYQDKTPGVFSSPGSLNRDSKNNSLGISPDKCNTSTPTSMRLTTSTSYAPRSNDHDIGTEESKNREMIVDEALIKKTISLTIYTGPSNSPDNDDRQTVHLISYFSAHDVLTGKILRPSQTDLKNVTVSPRVWQALKRSSLGGKFLLENEATFFLDRNYQLQSMSILTVPKAEGRFSATRRINSDSNIDIHAENKTKLSNAVVSQDPLGIDFTDRWQHRSSLDGIGASNTHTRKPGTSSLEYPSMSHSLDWKDNRNSKRRKFFDELDPRMSAPDLSSQFHEALIDPMSFSFHNTDQRPRTSPSSLARFSQYTLFSTDSKASGTGVSSAPPSIGSVDKPEGNVSPTMLTASRPKYESSALAGPLLPIYPENMYLAEPGPQINPNSFLIRRQVPTIPEFFLNQKALSGQISDSGHCITEPPNVFQNGNPLPPSQFHHTSAQETRFATANSIIQSPMPPASAYFEPNRSISNLGSDQPLMSNNLNIHASAFGVGSHPVSSSEKKFYLGKVKKEELVSPKNDPLASSVSMPPANSVKRNIYNDEGDYFNTGKTV